ncbi:radical SAM protein [Desulfoferrobacter suflitae]|uniref:radical SAM protein n=1 Tax=Desulfoferrobacter suflitae TaxID=2865782 RepID=UPI002164334E|nr:radical SAM protein [Desulfoferrobacter suflitae]MCK8603271.1 radical SAM protein [Desulfoferrobacter suflitae]
MMNYSFLYQQIVNGYSSLPLHLLPGYSLPPLQLFLEVTYNCNLSCDFCQFLQSSDSGSMPASANRFELSIGECHNIVEQAPPTAVISFTGGEPFVKAGFADLLGAASERNKTHIFTNGTRIGGKTAESLVDLGSRNLLTPGLILVGISLEGLADTHNRITGRPWAYAKTIEGLHSLAHYKASKNRKYPLIELKTVISENNVRELYAIYQVAKQCRVDIFNVMAMSMLPQASRTGRCAAGSYLEPPPPVKPVAPVILEEQLRRIQEDAARSEIQLRTTPQGFDFREIINHYHDKRRLAGYRCYYPWYGVGISAYGDLLICPYTVTGNVREHRIKTLLNNRRARIFRKHLQAARIFPGCWGCCMLVPRKPRLPR